MKPSSDVPQIGSVITIGSLSNEKFVVGKILKGGMGEVYQLVPVRFASPPLALKTYQPSANREQFMREAEIWISLGDHPHIARALMYLDWQSKPSIISPWYKHPADASSTAEWSSAKFIDFTVCLIDGLRHAFTVGSVIHQDVKPANVLLDEKDEPRLTDFGLARFSGAAAQMIRSIVDVDSSMGHSMTLGMIGGTPLYMAPELFGGGHPSVHTDIFSLGVSVYEILTGQHPYLGPETGYRLRPTLRSEPLRHVIETRGKGFAPLISLITAAVQIEPNRRPSSYEALGTFFGGLPKAISDINREAPEDLIVRAAFLRDTGRAQESIELLRGALDARPVNPQLLNSYAIQMWRSGFKEEAYSAWNAAVGTLKLSGGRHQRVEYPDPAVNLAWRLVAENQFKQADELLSLVGQWCHNVRSILNSYMEISWWHLYNGRFEEAWAHTLRCGQSRAPDELSLWTVTLAAWLSDGSFVEKANTLGLMYSSAKQIGETTALIACVIAPYCSPELKSRLVAIAYPKYQSELAAMAVGAGFPSVDWREQLPQTLSRLVIRSLDTTVTGGRNLGAI